jgi:1-acyl-sn-glycerol-3-phosphate acyltransferase
MSDDAPSAFIIKPRSRRRSEHLCGTFALLAALGMLATAMTFISHPRLAEITGTDAITGAIVILFGVIVPMVVLIRDPLRIAGDFPVLATMAALTLAIDWLIELPLMMLKCVVYSALLSGLFILIISYHYYIIFQIDCDVEPTDGRRSMNNTQYEYLAAAMIGAISCMQIALNTVNDTAMHLPWVQTFNVVLLLITWTGLLVISWWRLFRFTFERFIEFFIRIGYRIRAEGPGVGDFPLNGPLLVIANHACWWDPLFLAGVVPRPITPMMTAGFYDLWFLRPIMKHAVGVIRVPESRARREAPEIGEAIAALDNAECVVLFPEGYLRRKEDVPLRRFARGVSEILRARPDTPVVCCWIEGAWGSWSSWHGGPPARGKRIDIRRRIRIGMRSPIKVPSEALKNHWQTRVFLMNAVNEARRTLGLDPLPEFSVSSHDEEPSA